MFAILLALAACDAPTAQAPSVAPGTITDRGATVLTVNGTPIGSQELGFVYRRMRVPEEKIEEYAFSRGGKHVAEEYALGTVLYERALSVGLDKDPQIQLEMAFAARQVLAAAMRKKLADDAVTDAAIQKYYEDNKARFSRPEVRARHIQVPTEVMAKDVVARLEKGEKFETLAKELSTDKLTREKGGELAWFHERENTMWGAEAFAAQKGQVIGPVSSRIGWHVIEVLDKRDVTPLEDVRGEATEQIRHSQSTIVVEELRQSMKIEWSAPPAGVTPEDAPPAPAAAPAKHP